MPLVSVSIWCCFRNIPSAPEAALVSASCLYSLATLEVTGDPDLANFAVTECEHAAVWRWAVISPEGVLLEDGREPTRLQARTTAEKMLRLAVA